MMRSMGQTTAGLEGRSLVVVDLLKLALADVPVDDAWLHPHELEVQGTLRFPKRRSDWRLGRYTAKRALARRLDLRLRDIEVRAATDGAPEAFNQGRPLSVALSISHSGEDGLAAVAEAGTALGCDIETVERRPDVFVQDFFTSAERLLVGHATLSDRDALVTTIWSAKESALKAMRDGLRADTRDVEVRFPARIRAGWTPFEVCSATTRVRGWAASRDQTVITVVTDPAPSIPYVVAP